MIKNIFISFILFPWKQNKDPAKEDEPKAKKPSAYEMVSCDMAQTKRDCVCGCTSAFLDNRKLYG